MHTLPRQIDPRKFAQQAIDIKGIVLLQELERLCDALPSSKGDITAELSFGRTEQGLFSVTGFIKADVQNVCQRCLGQVPITLNCSLSLAIVWSVEEAEKLPKYLDPWVVGEGVTDVYQVVEDELLLSLPIVSYHDYDCVPLTHFSSGDKCSAVTTEKPDSPFRVLESLKGQLVSQDDSKTVSED